MHRPIVRWTRPFSRFAQIESAGGIVLLTCTVVAMVWVNSSAADFYASLLHVPITIGFNHLYLSEDLRYWINDGLMAVFFLLVGLEIKHEMLVGELSSFKLAALPVFAAISGFAAQLGFRLPNIIISPFTRRHYVSHIPMDHTAVIKFVENRFIGTSAHLTNRDAAQPNLLDFFDFTNVPWATPPTPPTPVSLTDPSSPGYNTCTPTNMGP